MKVSKDAFVPTLASMGMPLVWHLLSVYTHQSHLHGMDRTCQMIPTSRLDSPLMLLEFSLAGWLADWPTVFYKY